MEKRVLIAGILQSVTEVCQLELLAGSDIVRTMETDRNQVEQSYVHAARVARSEAKNFYYGFMLLPGGERRAIYAAYAFARECDDIVDAGLPTEEASLRLAAYRESLDRCLEGHPQGPVLMALRIARL